MTKLANNIKKKGWRFTENSLPELMTVKELIKYLHCSKNTAYQIIQSKTFPSMKILNKWYIDKDRLPDWIKQQEKKLKYSNWYNYCQITVKTLLSI